MLKKMVVMTMVLTMALMVVGVCDYQYNKSIAKKFCEANEEILVSYEGRDGDDIVYFSQDSDTEWYCSTDFDYAKQVVKNHHESKFDNFVKDIKDMLGEA